ncbi:hypothetical protein DPMN_095534 [Dreissena polymorpha]|uniref:Uncharacterized protein n=1 Tax=Dreissena polymorpha TaxID=45954 RepID=A0A9D4L7K3_DREPO|nr:hypothetical protein DPMN_095534 [Dreissena polymorpha]
MFESKVCPLTSYCIHDITEARLRLLEVLTWKPVRCERDVNDIMDNAKLLRGTSFGISRDYPREISDARKQLWPEFKAARDKYGAKNVKMAFLAALVIHGETVKNAFPDWHSTLRCSRNADVTAHVYGAPKGSKL